MKRVLGRFFKVFMKTDISMMLLLNRQVVLIALTLQPPQFWVHLWAVTSWSKCWKGQAAQELRRVAISNWALCECMPADSSCPPHKLISGVGYAWHSRPENRCTTWFAKSVDTSASLGFAALHVFDSLDAFCWTWTEANAPLWID